MSNDSAATELQTCTAATERPASSSCVDDSIGSALDRLVAAAENATVADSGSSAGVLTEGETDEEMAVDHERYVAMGVQVPPRRPPRPGPSSGSAAPAAPGPAGASAKARSLPPRLEGESKRAWERRVKKKFKSKPLKRRIATAPKSRAMQGQRRPEEWQPGVHRDS